MNGSHSNDSLASSPLARRPVLSGPWPFLIVCALFALLELLTRSPFLGDTIDYVDDIQSSLSCLSIRRCPELWDSAHLLWRPLGHFLSPPLLPLLNRLVGGDIRMAITLLLVSLSGLALLIAALLLYSILVGDTGNVLVSLFLTVGFLCTSANLDGLHSGTSYAPGLACLIGALWYLQRGARTSKLRAAALAGLLGTLAVSFWLPYLVTLPALLCWILLDYKDRRLSAAVMLVLCTAATGGFLFGIGAHFHGVGSLTDFRIWLQSGGHGMEQNRTFIRSLFGFPRAFFDMGQFGVRMKQFLFKDPYANVKLGALFWLRLWKIGLFYVALTSLAFLYRTIRGRRTLVIFGVALLANMALALVFEGGSPERYYPLYPFLFVAAAQCLSFIGIPRLARAFVMLLFLAIIMVNLPAYSASRIHSEQDREAQRISSLLPLRPASCIFVVGDDSISSLRLNAPFHEINRGTEFQVKRIYQPMIRTSYWKHDFAAMALSIWEQGGDVWVTTRVWSERPRQEWNWVEGDDPNAKWKNITGFFQPLDHSSVAGRTDGFVLLLGSANNQSLLTFYANE
jgi:hypothetical protein